MRRARRQANVPISATAVVVDLRNFTPNLEAAPCDEQGINVFCHFLAGFQGLCLDASLVAMPEAIREAPPLYVSSTGDGAILLFYDEARHWAHATLAALVLRHVLGRICARYNERLPDPRIPPTAYGIGVESGTVARVYARPCTAAEHPVLDTFIGDCINVASRVQEVTKRLHDARTILSVNTNALLCRHLLDVDYGSLMQQDRDEPLDDAEHRRLQAKMKGLNDQLCLSFIHLHRLRGVDEALPLFRVSTSAARLGNERFEWLLDSLVAGDSAHLAEVQAVLAQDEW